VPGETPVRGPDGARSLGGRSGPRPGLPASRGPRSPWFPAGPKGGLGSWKPRCAATRVARFPFRAMGWYATAAPAVGTPWIVNHGLPSPGESNEHPAVVSHGAPGAPRRVCGRPVRDALVCGPGGGLSRRSPRSASASLRGPRGRAPAVSPHESGLRRSHPALTSRNSRRQGRHPANDPTFCRSGKAVSAGSCPSPCTGPGEHVRCCCGHAVNNRRTYPWWLWWPAATNPA